MEIDDGSRDELIEVLIPAASETIQSEFEREFAPATDSETRRLRVSPTSTSRGWIILDLAPYDLRSAVSITLHPEQPEISYPFVQFTNYVLEPEPSKWGVYTHLQVRPDVDFNSNVAQSFGFSYLDIDGAWGFPTIPSTIELATARTVAAWLPRLVTAMNVEGLDDAGHVIAASTWAIPPDARRLGEKFRRRPNVF